MATVNLGRIKPVFRGAYSGSTAYVVDDIVTHGNESFICIQAHGAGTQATSQGSYWTKLAAKGADGTDVGTTITTQGDILYRDGSGLQRLAKGTAGQALKMNTAANAPELGTISSDFVKLATVNVSSGVSSVAIDGNGSWIDNTVYGGYKFYIRNLSTSNDSGTSVVRFRVNFSGTAHSSGNYYSFAKASSGSSSTSTVSASYDWGSSQFSLSYNNMDAEEARSGYGIIELLNTGGDENGGSGDFWPNIISDFYSHHSNSSSLYNYNQMGHLANNAPISGITIIPTGGNIDGGTIIAYGRKK